MDAEWLIALLLSSELGTNQPAKDSGLSLSHFEHEGLSKQFCSGGC